MEVNCSACSLNANGSHRLVPGRGPKYPGGIALIGEAPGENEERLGKPFVGRSGRLLENCLRGMELSPTLITNTVLHRPPLNRDPIPEEIAVCWESFVYESILACRPSLIVAVGSIASHWLCGVGVEKGHGHIFPSKHDDLPPVFVVRHPAHVLRDPEKFLESFYTDFKILRNYLDPQNLPVGNDNRLTVDLETSSLNPRTGRIYGFAWNRRGTTIYQHGSPPDWLRQELFNSIWFNANFDLAWFPEPHCYTEVDDVALMAGVLGRPALNLRDLVWFDLGVLHYSIKELAAKLQCEIEAIPEEALEEKSKLDVIFTRKLFDIYSGELEREGLWNTYLLERQVGPLIRRVEKTPTVLDLDYMIQLDSELAAEIARSTTEVAGYLPAKEIQLKTKVKVIPPNPRSRDQVIAALQARGVVLRKRTLKHKTPALDAEVLQELTDPLAKAYAKLQQDSKLRNYTTSLANEQTDGFIFPQFNQLGAISGRLSSSKREE